MADRETYFEKFTFPVKIMNSLNINKFTEEKRKLWDQRLQDAKDKVIFFEFNADDFTKAKSSNIKGVIILDFHNVFDSDLEVFVKQCSKWNNSGFEVHVCSFVGKGTPIHASLLAFCEDPVIQKVLKSLIICFDRKHLKKGKGNVIMYFLEHMKNVPIYFVDDGVENLENVLQVTKNKYTNLHLFHYVVVPHTRDSKTPHGLKRVENFEELVLYI